MIYSFSNLPKEKTQVGGKAYMLAMMTQLGIRVPDGLILDARPSIEDFECIKNFLGESFSVAVRSSATGEDSKENSFAGQNSTFLYVSNLDNLKIAIENCFDSINKSSSKAYRKHFLGSDKEIPMNVVIQHMIDPMYAGVFFSKDPRNTQEGWLLEYIDGVGEDLVSGAKTPFSISQKKQFDHNLDAKIVSEIVNFAKSVEQNYQDDFDIEWAIDKRGVVYLLQARPITAKKSVTNLKQFAHLELDKLKKKFSKDTTWDGQTFAELSICPTAFSTELWQKSFIKGNSFDKALKEIGYLGFDNIENPNESILDNIFGKNYINLNKLAPLYFGPMPYSIEPLPSPHLKFKLNKISLNMILSTPKTILKMLSAGLTVNSHRKEIIALATKALVEFSTTMDRPMNPEIYNDWTLEELLLRLEKEQNVFTKDTLTWSYVLIAVTETTIQTLQAILASIYDTEKASHLIRDWTGKGVKTETFEMGHYFRKACAKPELRVMFLEKYGHRGPGELDLSSKRWIEFGNDSFYDLSLEEYESYKNKHTFNDVEKEISEIKSFKKALVLDEWKILKSLLELREKWKMNLLKPFAHIRYALLEIQKRYDLKDGEIFWLKMEEIKKFKIEYQELAQKRMKESDFFKNYNFSAVTSLAEIEDVLEGRISAKNNLTGTGISPGMIKGEILIIKNPNDIKNIDWPINPIIVTQSTDPGWTPVFMKAKGIIVEKGGVLSHCAIVAREMGIPAVSGIINCHNNFKGGEHVWLNGNNGTISIIK